MSKLVRTILLFLNALVGIGALLKRLIDSSHLWRRSEMQIKLPKSDLKLDFDNAVQATQEKLSETIDQLSKVLSPGSIIKDVDEAARGDALRDRRSVQFLFATTRQIHGSGALPEHYTGERAGRIHFGSAAIRVPEL